MIFVAIFSLHPEEVLRMTASEVIQILLMYIGMLFLIYFMGIYMGIFVFLEERKKQKKTEKKDKKKKDKKIPQIATDINRMISGHRRVIIILIGLILLPIMSFYYGMLVANQKNNFKVIDNEYAVLYEGSNTYLVAKIEGNKINTLIQKVIDKENIISEERVFEGEFLRRFVE
jgi:NADH:ubiquinone oxidoreductase subunit 5 (subunit L)/multisubunit Na+/H+ antiporter MnhA subunit